MLASSEEAALTPGADSTPPLKVSTSTNVQRGKDMPLSFHGAEEEEEKQKASTKFELGLSGGSLTAKARTPSRLIALCTEFLTKRGF